VARQAFLPPHDLDNDGGRMVVGTILHFIPISDETRRREPAVRIARFEKHASGFARLVDTADFLLQGISSRDKRLCTMTNRRAGAGLTPTYRFGSAISFTDAACLSQASLALLLGLVHRYD
jgi:hypothetical protein